MALCHVARPALVKQPLGLITEDEEIAQNSRFTVTTGSLLHWVRTECRKKMVVFKRSLVISAGNETSGSLDIRGTKLGAAPLPLNERLTLGGDLVSEVLLRKVKQTFFECISLAFTADGANQCFVS